MTEALDNTEAALVRYGAITHAGGYGADDHAELRRLAEAATPGPWFLGDRWLIQGASHCLCKRGKLIREQVMDINGETMLAHVHEVDAPWYKHGILTEPWEDGHPRSVVYTTSEYGHPAREDEEFIATFDPPTVLALLDEVESLRARAEAAEAVIARAQDCLTRHFLETSMGQATLNILAVHNEGTTTS